MYSVMDPLELKLNGYWCIGWRRERQFSQDRLFHHRFVCSENGNLEIHGPTSDGGSCRQCHTNVWYYRKYGDIRWNHIPISFRSKVISVSGLAAAILQFRMPNHIRSAISRPRSKSGMVEKVGLAVWFASPSLLHSFFHFQFGDRRN